MEMNLWKHQEEAVERAKLTANFAFLFDPGAGKSAASVCALKHKYNTHKKLLPTLVLCPPVVISNWKNEFKLWSKIPEAKIIPLIGTGKKRAELIKSAPQDSILITNYEALLMPEVFKLLKSFLAKPSCLVLDESHKVKDMSSKRTNKAIELGDVCTYKYILTGTPVLNDLMDIFSQFRVLDGGESFGGNFCVFRARYFEDKNKHIPQNRYFPNWQPRCGAAEEIKKIMAPISMHVDKSTCLTLPPLVKKIIEVEMSVEQKRLYQAMKQDLIATIKTAKGDKHSIAELAITKALRLQQISSGHLRVENDTGEASTIIIKDNPRKAALKQLLEEITPGHKVLVWAVFHANYEDIREVCNDLKLKYSELHGLVKDKDSEAQRFREDPEIRVLIGHPGSGGIGVNLVEASYMIYYSRNFSLEFDIQSEARAYRGGSHIHESITRIDLVCKQSIDELVLNSLANKVEISQSVLKEKLGEL